MKQVTSLEILLVTMMIWEGSHGAHISFMKRYTMRLRVGASQTNNLIGYQYSCASISFEYSLYLLFHLSFSASLHPTSTVSALNILATLTLFTPTILPKAQWLIPSNKTISVTLSTWSWESSTLSSYYWYVISSPMNSSIYPWGITTIALVNSAPNNHSQTPTLNEH